MDKQDHCYLIHIYKTLGGESNGQARPLLFDTDLQNLGGESNGQARPLLFDTYLQNSGR